MVIIVKFTNMNIYIWNKETLNIAKSKFKLKQIIKIINPTNEEI